MNFHLLIIQANLSKMYIFTSTFFSWVCSQLMTNQLIYFRVTEGQLKMATTDDIVWLTWPYIGLLWACVLWLPPWTGWQKLMILPSTHLLNPSLLSPPHSCSSVMSCLYNEILCCSPRIPICAPLHSSHLSRGRNMSPSESLRQSRRQKQAKLSSFCFPQTQGSWGKIRGFAKERREESCLQM